MTDADRFHAYGPLQPMAPDCWHDRPRRDPWPIILTALGTLVVGWFLIPALAVWSGL